MTKTEYIALLQTIKIRVKKQHITLKKKRIFRQINEWKKICLEKKPKTKTIFENQIATKPPKKKTHS